MRGRMRLAFLLVLSLALVIVGNGYLFAEDVNLGDDPDIPEDYLGASVSAKIGWNDAWMNTLGQISRSDDFVDASYGSGTVTADVLGDGTGVVTSLTTALQQLAGQTETFGNSCQSLKPMTFTSNVHSDGETVTVSVDVHFDGLLTVREDATGNTAEARVEYLAEITQYNAATGEREIYQDNSFDGVAWVEDDGTGATVVVPETYEWMEEEGPQPNAWYGNGNLSTKKVVLAGAGAGEINVADLPAASQAQATNDIGAGRTLYYLVYDETFTFDATVGETYYMEMDLLTAAGVLGNTGSNSYAQSDFSNTIRYEFSGAGLAVATEVFVDGNETINTADFFGGASSSTQLSDATLTWAGNNNLASDMEMAAGTVNTFDTVAFTPTLSGDISGSGTLDKTGAGTLTLTGGLAGFTGRVLLSQGTLDINSASDRSLSGDIFGAGTLLKQGAGTLTLSGALNGFTGAVNVNAGTLNLSPSSDTSYSGVIGGTGTLQKSGASTLNLTGNSGGFGGATQVDGGTLAVNGTLGGDVAVASGATLGGSGTVSGNVSGAGNVAPGNSIGTINIGGNYNPAAGSQLVIEVNNSATDQVIVGGTANVTAAEMVVEPLERITADREFRFMTATSITGPFASLDTSNIDFTVELRAGGAEYWVLLDRQPYASVMTTWNQAAITPAFDSAFDSATGDLATVITSLDTLDNASLGVAFDQLGGELFGTLSAVGRDNTSFVYGMLARRLRADMAPRCGASPCDDPASGCDAGWTGWISSFGRGGAATSDGNAHGYHNSLGGLLAVFEKSLTPFDRLGFFYSYGRSYVSTSGGLDNIADVDSHHWGGYVTKRGCLEYLTLAAGVGHDSYQTARRLQFGAIDRTARADHSGWQSSVYAEAGRNYVGSRATLQPFAALNYIFMHQNALTESGANSMNLSVGDLDMHSLRTILGTRLATTVPRRAGIGSPEVDLHLFWTHDLLGSVMGVGTISPTGLPSSFAVRGVNTGRDWIAMGPSIKWDFSQGCKLFAEYDLTFNRHAAYHTGSGGIELAW